MQGAQASLGAIREKPMRAFARMGFPEPVQSLAVRGRFSHSRTDCRQVPGAGTGLFLAHDFWLMTRAMSRQRLE